MCADNSIQKVNISSPGQDDNVLFNTLMVSCLTGNYKEYIPRVTLLDGQGFVKD